MKRPVLISSILLFVLTTTAFLACETQITDPGEPGGELPRQLSAAESKLVEADGSFSFDLFRATVAAQSQDENIIISPLSISVALAMTLNGAEGDTYDAMAEVLHLAGISLDEINEGYQSLIELLTTADPQVQMKIANSIWHSDRFAVNSEFRERMETYFDADLFEADFEDPESADRINQWVEEKTEGLITELLDEIEEDRIMYLINALYFKGDWLRQFDPSDTERADFRLESGESVEVDKMSQNGLFATYFSGDVQLIELPYGDSLFSMSVMMPADPDMPINQFVEVKLTSANLNEWRSNLTVDPRESLIQLPKFELEYEISYEDILKEMGMEIAFTYGVADFSGLSEDGRNNLFLDEVLHKVYINVDEEGTEAAAATSVGVMPTSMPPQMIVDRPFIFVIHERNSGANLFMGKVKNPAAES